MSRRCPRATRGGGTGGVSARHLTPDSSLLRSWPVRVGRADEQERGRGRVCGRGKPTWEARLRRARLLGHYPVDAPITGFVSAIPWGTITIIGMVWFRGSEMLDARSPLGSPGCCAAVLLGAVVSEAGDVTCDARHLGARRRAVP